MGNLLPPPVCPCFPFTGTLALSWETLGLSWEEGRGRYELLSADSTVPAGFFSQRTTAIASSTSLSQHILIHGSLLNTEILVNKWQQNSHSGIPGVSFNTFSPLCTLGKSALGHCSEVSQKSLCAESLPPSPGRAPVIMPEPRCPRKPFQGIDPEVTRMAELQERGNLMPFAHSLCGLCLRESQRLHGEPLMTVTGKH